MYTEATCLPASRTQHHGAPPRLSVAGRGEELLALRVVPCSTHPRHDLSQLSGIDWSRLDLLLLKATVQPWD